jgi:hypothetical protein
MLKNLFEKLEEYLVVFGKALFGKAFLGKALFGKAFLGKALFGKA